VGTRTEYQTWRDDYDGEIHETGSENVDMVAWHRAPSTESAVATTFHEEREAAVATLRRQAWGKIYRDLL
ncbi:MAG: DUF5809 family protein, partial [Halobacteriaceae archaeon]